MVTSRVCGGGTGGGRRGWLLEAVIPFGGSLKCTRCQFVGGFASAEVCVDVPG